MSQSKVIILTLFVCVLGILVAENSRWHRPLVNAESIKRTPTRLVGKTIRAPGRIAGSTEEIELHSQLRECVKEIHVRHGDYVESGALLVTLEQDSLLHEQELAAAILQQREAELSRLENGVRNSEIETARLEFDAAMARLDAASSRLTRTRKLIQGNAASDKDLEESNFAHLTLKAMAEASRNRLKTLEQPARDEDIIVASAAIRAAKASFLLAQERLSKSEIRAPASGEILKINAQIGELPRRDDSEPLVIMCNSRHQRAIIEVDEFDALRVSLGQRCELSIDGIDGVVAQGTITEVAPRMQRKQVFGQWAGERNDTFSRRVWVDLDQGSPVLPIALPVRAEFQIGS